MTGIVLSSIFNNIVSKASVDFTSAEIQDIIAAVEELVHRYAERIEVQNPDIKISRIIPCGSMKDGSALWKTLVNDPDRSFIWKDIGEVPYIEFDFLALLEKPTELRFN